MTREERLYPHKDKEVKQEEIQPQKHSKAKKWLLIILCIFLITLCYARFIEPNSFQVKEYKVESSKLPLSFDGLKIVHFSDVHYGTISKKQLENIVEEINSLKPDIIVFTGDLYDERFQITEDFQKDIIETLSKLNSKLGKFAVSGNHDYSDPIYNTLIEKTGFTLLDNSSKFIYLSNEDPIEIVGYPSIREDNPNFNYELSNYFKIALIHEPDAITNLLDKDIDMVLAGHSHGGQVRIPFIGAVARPEGSKNYPDNYYDFNNTKLYVSYGIGTSLFKLRFMAQPSINLYRFYKI